MVRSFELGTFGFVSGFELRISSLSLRYVILRHETPPGAARASHYDLMFDAGPALRTWAVVAPPDTPGEQPAEALADHRREYLTYEGPTSGNRGSVTRWDEGEYESLADDTAAFAAKVSGRRLRGEVRIAAGANATFDFRPVTNG
jgi:hypothetical protein